MTDFVRKSPRIVVYGSCVARDTVETVRDRVDLLAYVARQSLLSVGSDASVHLPAALDLDSPFQERMVRDDFAGRFDDVLAAVAPSADLILWDLADERHGVHRFPDGSIVTRSIDTMRSRTLTDALQAAVHLAFGDDEHFALWKASATLFASRLETLRLRERMVLLEVPWAALTVAGEPSPWSMGVRASEANQRYERYYEVARGLGVRTLRVDASVVRSDPMHRWGLAPFHYAPVVYRRLVEQLSTSLDLQIGASSATAKTD